MPAASRSRPRLAGPIFTDDADHRAIGRGGIESGERRGMDFAEGEGHKGLE